MPGFIILYIVGALITAGAIGGLRDEMDGIADMATIFFWPLALGFLGILFICRRLYAFGAWLRASRRGDAD